MTEFTLKSALDAKLGMEITESSPQRVVGRVPVQGNTQPVGLWHGGASCVMAETLASIGSFLHGQTLGLKAVGTELNATHHRSVTEGWVTGTATPIHLGRTSTSYEVVLVDDAGKRLCTARVSCRLV